MHILPIREKKARKKSSVKAVRVLLFLALLIGVGGSLVWADNDLGLQLVLVLDLSNPPEGDQGPDLCYQASSFLVRLLKDQDNLGLIASGEKDGIILPTAKLNPEHRAQVLNKLARFEPIQPRKPFVEVMHQALKIFQTESPGRRVLFILSDGARENYHQKKNIHIEEIRKIADQAQEAGVAIFSASLATGGLSDEIKTLTLASGGRFWEGKTTFDLHLAVLNFYQYLVQPQEAPINGTVFRLDPWVRQAILVAARSVPGKGVVLTTPSGARINPRTYAKTIRWVAGQAYDLITISHPASGIWSLAGARTGDNRVFLDTELTLSTAGTPREVGEDEALSITAALLSPRKDLSVPNMSTSTEFRAELKFSDNKLLITELKAPESGATPSLPLGVRVGRFPPLHQEGEAALKVLALGKTFQRLVSLQITITKPWYRVAMPTTEAQKSLSIRFQPDPNRRPEQVEGTLTLQSALGGLAGLLIKPTPGAEIVMDRPPGSQDSCVADLHLTGTVPGGRPLVISSGPQRLETHRTVPDKPPKLDQKPALEEKAHALKPPSLFQKLKRRWLSLALIGLGIVVFLASAFLLWHERREAEDSEDEGDTGGSSSKNILRLQAQVEALTKDKAQLQDALKSKTLQAEQLMAEKADLQASLERVREKSQGHNNLLEQLEKKLEEAER